MEFRNQHSIYLQIADYICEEILCHVWKAYDKIPSVRELAVQVEVNPNTVVRTYGYLEGQGVIYKERGLGYFVAKNGYGQALKLKKELFLREHLPIVFKSMDLMDMSLNDLQNLYKNYKKQIRGNKNEK
jgi:DNA-binding transcriptional regulator YhcF (GntR family)